MPVRQYSELHPAQQDRILCSITEPGPLRVNAHNLLKSSNVFMVIVDAYNGNLTLTALPCAYDVYLREQQEINTGRWEISHA